MSIKEGVYLIRFIPPHIKLPFEGGSYATGEIINSPIVGHGLNPEVPGDRNWSVRPVKGKKDTYTIIEYRGVLDPNPNAGPGLVLPGWGLGKKRRGYNDNILLTLDIAEWVITVDDVKTNVCTISEPSKMIGAINCVNINGDVLVLTTFPIVEKAYPLPQWEFIFIKFD